MSQTTYLDMVIVSSVFLLGVIFSYMLGTYRNHHKAKMDALVQEFQGQRGKYEKALQSTKRLYKWKLRVKILEKIYYVSLLIGGFIFYKSPYMVNIVFVQNGHWSISAIAGGILIINYIGFYLQSQHETQEK